MNETKFHRLRVSAGLSLLDFSNMFKIPYRTIQNWESGVRTPPDYLVDMMVYILKNEGKI